MDPSPLDKRPVCRGDNHGNGHGEYEDDGD
jgi:hypothetical protein